MLHAELGDRPQLQAHAAAIAQAAGRSADLTRQLLAFARKGKYQSVPVNLHHLIAEVISLLGRSIDKRIRIRQHLDANPSTTLGDPTLLENALLNIALNARDAMPDGGELLFATETVRVDEIDAGARELRPGAYLQVSVRDTGVGMDAGTRQRIFEPFFTTKEKGKGTGLGMAAVYGTVKSHQGGISVYSEPGRGTTIRLHLPLLQTDGADEIPLRASQAVRGHGHILVVDDEDQVRTMAATVLQHLGYRVTLCRDGTEAVALYRTAWATIDCVILDMIMPELGGRETFLALRQINPQVKAILASGYSLNEEAQALLDQGALGFVQKPFHLSELSRAVAEVLAPAARAAGDEGATRLPAASP